MSARILVVDDEPSVRDVLRLGLSARGYLVEAVGGGREAMQRVRQDQFDLVLLDLMLPDVTGMDVLSDVRAWSSVPIIVLSVLADPTEKVRALDAGADDYLTKAFDMDELVARIRVALLHHGSGHATVFRTGELTIDFDRRRAAMAGRELGLTPTEYEILKTLAEHAGKVLTYESLLKSVWGASYGTERSYLHVYIGRLRRKLERDPLNPNHVMTEPGVGYRLQIQPPHV